tara:strand:- start:98 stop:1318 length:1221 start_codon:yes stop_codon:yes gene_type:complete
MAEAEILPEVKTAIKRIDGDQWATMVVTQHVVDFLYSKLPVFDGLVDDAGRIQDEIDGLMDVQMQTGNVIALPVQRAKVALEQSEKNDPIYRDMCIADIAVLRQAIRDAVQDGLDKVDAYENAEELIGGEGWTRAGKTNPMATPADIKKRQDMASQLSGTVVQRVLELAGKFMSVARRAQARKSSEPTSITGIEYGSELERLLSDEVANLDGGICEDLFWYNFANEQLSQYKLEGKSPQARGPIVALVDDSGSMKGPREEWAKATALVLLQLARKQKRSFVLGTFTTQVNSELRFEPGSVVDSEALVDWISSSTSRGGTDFEEPLNWAIDQVSENYPKADIVMIADGKAAVDEEWRDGFKKSKRKLDANMISIGLQCSPGVLRDLSDSFVEVRNLHEPVPEVVFAL